MDNKNVLIELESLRVDRSRYGAFESYEDLLNWADSVRGLLTHNEKRLKEFEELYSLISSNEELDRNIRYPTINKMIGVLNTSIVELEKSTVTPDTPHSPASYKTYEAHNWHNTFFGKIYIGVVIVVISTATIWVIKYYLGVL